VPAPDERATWRSLAREVHRWAGDGPVQLDLPFREPLLGTETDLPAPDPQAEMALPGTTSGPPVYAESSAATRATGEVPGLDRQRGVILAGGRSGVAPKDVAELRRLTGWPILADPTSGMRHLDGVVTTADSLLRHRRFADDHAPEVVIRIGRPPASKVVAQWVVRTDPLVIQVGGPGVIDPDHNVSTVATIDEVLAMKPKGATGTTWPVRWKHAERRADEAIKRTIAAHGRLTEPGAARTVADRLPSDAVLTVASSMPVRDLEWFGGSAACAHANRGANGIDGVVSTGLGRALRGTPSVVLIGDLAFVHDSNALVGLAARSADLRIVVVDNDGGGIFSFLPQASELPPQRFEQLFGTPLGTDVVALAAAHGVPARTVETASELADQLVVPGPWLVRVPSDRAANVVVHDALHGAVAEALG
jgi:2-succinyl-5-enolpyruvyl-6-hydroxy-3-cyclohexene-1-carboxylate synthase